MKLKDYKNLKMQQDPEFGRIYEEMKQELSVEVARYEESLTRTGETVPLDTVEIQSRGIFTAYVKHE